MTIKVFEDVHVICYLQLRLYKQIATHRTDRIVTLDDNLHVSIK